VEASNTGAPTAPHTSNIYYVTVRVTQKLPLTFLSVIGAGQWAYVQARATAGVNASAGGGCLYVLNATANKAYSATGGNISTSCGFYVDSNKSDAAYMSGGVLNLNNGANFIIHGQLSNGGGNIVPSGNVLQSQPAVANPFSGMTAPTPAGNCITDPNISAGNNITLNPGTYCGLTISGGTNIYFNSGTYIIKTGSLTISGGTFSNTLSNLLIYIPASNTTGKINLNGVNGSGMNWSGLVGGNQDGFLFWVANSAAQSLSGGAYNLNGVMYMPNCAFQYTGGNGTQQTVVVDTITITGGNLTSSAPSSFFSGGGQVGGAFLVE